MGNKVKRFTESDLFSQTDFASHLDQATRSYGERARYAQEYMADFLDVRDMVKENVYKLSHEAVQGLLDKTMNPEDKKLLELLSIKSDTEFFQKFMEEYSSKSISAQSENFFKNQTLNDLYNKVVQREDAALEMIRRKNNHGNAHLTSDLFDLANTDPGNEFEDINGILREEIGKEFFLRVGMDKEGNFSGERILDLVDSLNIHSQDAKNAKRLGLFTILEHDSHINDVNVSGSLAQESIFLQAANVENNIVESESRSAEEVRKMIADISKEQNSSLATFYDEADEIGNPMPYNSWITMRKSTGILDVVGSLNNWEKTKATAKQYAKELGAGRGDMENVSTSTFAPYFMLARLSDDANSIGFGFSAESMGSTYQRCKY